MACKASTEPSKWQFYDFVMSKLNCIFRGNYGSVYSKSRTYEGISEKDNESMALHRYHFPELKLADWLCDVFVQPHKSRMIGASPDYQDLMSTCPSSWQLHITLKRIANWACWYRSIFLAAQRKRDWKQPCPVCMSFLSRFLCAPCGAPY